MKILIVGGKKVLVDDEVFEKIKNLHWYISKYGYIKNSKRKKGSQYQRWLHRMILDLGNQKLNPVEVDHINGNKLDNRKENLRVCTRHQNLMNMGPRKTNTSGYKGVLREKGKGRWIAKIQFNKKDYKKRFKTKEEAAIAYNEMAKRFFGEFAYLNTL